MRIDEDRSYRALRDGDPSFDGRFFAGVVTTGVYCRAQCPVPQPALRRNVRFYRSAAEAQSEGFRACRVCHPERSPGTPVWGDLSPVVSRALVLISDGALDDGDIEGLSARLGVTSRHLRRLFTEQLGAPPVAIAKARRTHFARRLLDETDLPVTEVAFASGFRSIRQFNEDLRAAFGRPPNELRKRKTPRRVTGGASVQMRLAYRPPLDWPRMIRYLQARATPGVEVAEHDRYRRTILTPSGPGALELAAVAEEPHLILRLWLPSNDGLIDLEQRARRIFDLDADPLAVSAALGSDPVIGRLVRARSGLRVPQAWDPFELAVRAVLGQQISVRAATTLATRVVRAWGKPADGVDLPGLTHVFPTPATLAEADLTTIGTTGAVARTVRTLARAIADGELSLDAARGLDGFVSGMCELPGIGPWTAHYIAMRALGEPDAFPASDLGLRRALGGDRLPTARALERIAEAWRPWRAYAAMYLWNMPPARGKKGES